MTWHRAVSITNRAGVLAAALSVANCDSCPPNNPTYIVPTINKQAPSSVVVTGPATLGPGETGTFTLTITLDSPISTTNNFAIRA